MRERVVSIFNETSFVFFFLNVTNTGKIWGKMNLCKLYTKPKSIFIVDKSTSLEKNSLLLLYFHYYNLGKSKAFRTLVNGLQKTGP